MDGPGAAAAAVAYLVLIVTLVVWLQLAHKGWWRVDRVAGARRAPP